ncbi:secreted protein containing DUF1566 [Beggiatoa sp. PS]|nr:secreted protein containing DUF1566 [Beggiatoa sp. PS]
MKRYIQLSLVPILLSSPMLLLAGDLEPTTAPGSTNSYIILDICNRLDSGTVGSQIPFTEPTALPGSTGCTLNDIMNKAPVKDNTNGVEPSYVSAGKTYWGLTDSNWGLKTGTKTPTSVAKTEQTLSYRTGDDGTHQKGVALTGTRFIDNSDGTITDKLTGLIWTKDTNCLGSTQIWDNAIDYANALTDGICGLSDGSVAGDWRLPNVKELQSLIDYSQFGPALPSSHPFLNVQTDDYWSSTEDSNSSSLDAWNVHFNLGRVGIETKTNANAYVWSVRGGQ